MPIGGAMLRKRLNSLLFLVVDSHFFGLRAQRCPQSIDSELSDSTLGSKTNCAIFLQYLWRLLTDFNATFTITIRNDQGTSLE